MCIRDRITWVIFFAPQIAIFFLSSCNACAPLSINTTEVAPRDKASSPRAPVPAKRSRILQFSNRLPNLPAAKRLKIDSLTRSLVGLKFADGSPLPRPTKLRPLLIPLIIRTILTMLLNWNFCPVTGFLVAIYLLQSNACRSYKIEDRSVRLLLVAHALWSTNVKSVHFHFF